MTIDLRNSDTGLNDFVQALGSVVSRLNPDSPIRKIFFPASYQERVQRQIEKQLPPEQAAQVATQPARQAVANEKALPLSEGARITAKETRQKGAEADLGIASAERNLEMLRVLNRIMPPEDAARFLFHASQSQDIADQLGIATSQQQLEVLRRGQELGLDADALVRLNILNYRVEAQGAHLDDEALRRFQTIWENSTGTDRELLTLGMSGGRGNGLIQSILSTQQFNQQASLESLRASLTAPGDLIKHEQDVLKFRLDLQGAQQDLIDRARDPDTKKDEIPSLIGQINDLGRSMFRVDPSSAVSMASPRLGLFGGVKGINVEVKDFLDSNDGSDVVMAYAQRFVDDGMTPEAEQDLRRKLSNSASGITNERAYQAIIDLATQLQDGTFEEIRSQAAAQAGMALRGDAPAPRQSRVDQLQEQFNAVIATGNPADISRAMKNTFWDLQLAKLTQYFFSGQQQDTGLRTSRPSAERFNP